MDIGTQQTVGGDLQDFADVDHERSRQRRRFDPSAVSLHLKPGDLILQKNGHEAGILVRADTLVTLIRVAAGIADDLQQLVWYRRVDRLEDVVRLVEGCGKGPQHPDRQRSHLGLIVQQHGVQIRQRCRPLVRALQPQPRGRGPIDRQGLTLSANVDLLTPIRLAPRMLKARPVIAAEMRRLDHLDGELVRLG